MERYLRQNLLRPGPRLTQKRIYRVAVSQRLKNTLTYCMDAWTGAMYIQYGTVCNFQALYAYTSASHDLPPTKTVTPVTTQALSLAREGQLQDIVTPPSTSILNLNISLKKPHTKPNRRNATAS